MSFWASALPATPGFGYVVQGFSPAFRPESRAKALNYVKENSRAGLKP